MDGTYLKILKIISNNSVLSQRYIAKEINLSIGKVNYILNELIEKGYIKMNRFKSSQKKCAYAYIITPKGLRKKIELTYEFLKLKSREYETIKNEIDELSTDIREYEALQDNLRLNTE